MLKRIVWIFASIVGTGFFLQACAAYQPGPVSITIDRGQEGRIYFTSQDAYDFADVLKGQAQSRIIHGDLTLPPPDFPLRGGIILSHGSGGPSGLHERTGAWLAKQGLAVFRLDHFGPRNVSSTARDQIKITAQGMLVDVIAARQLLATHPDLDAAKIGHMGWSKGGIVALSSAVDRLSKYAGAEMPLAFAVAYYPFCGFGLGTEKVSTPLLIQIGAEDNWTPAAPCQTLVDAWQSQGAPVEIDVYPNARHGFDSRLGNSEFSGAVTVRDTTSSCTLSVDENGRTVSLDGSYTLSTPEGRIAYLQACGTRGVTYGGNPTAKDASWARIKAFIDKHLP
ncbi:MAG: dienelactone hydrolase family protein [Pseudomonadota bacterium]